MQQAFHLLDSPRPLIPVCLPPKAPPTTERLLQRTYQHKTTVSVSNTQHDGFSLIASLCFPFSSFFCHCAISGFLFYKAVLFVLSSDECCVSLISTSGWFSLLGVFMGSQRNNFCAQKKDNWTTSLKPLFIISERTAALSVYITCSV
ncbi:hypothetical protein ATANTOWER_029611 [Ataeniobius toweri]|uniref:Uncharacterized protein n=1 Tax=Ataeniobius toweri TaxID=208326 RepID=A0ABU7C4N6_9TELE|nr:hypothetical protein [Ataeniobius toweri]